MIDYRQYRNDYIDDDDEIENYRLHSLPRPELILPQVQRTDTSTDSSAINYTNIIPKSILKTGSNITPPPLSLSSTAYLQIQDSRSSSKNDESPRTSVKVNTDQSIPIDYPIHIVEKRIPIQPILSSTNPILSKHRMRFANVSQLNDVEWEVPREFQPIPSNHERSPSTIIDPKTRISWQRELNIGQSHYLSNDDITQQQAFEY